MFFFYIFVCVGGACKEIWWSFTADSCYYYWCEVDGRSNLTFRGANSSKNKTTGTHFAKGDDDTR